MMVEVDVPGFLREITRDGVQIIDVRTPAEFNAGHLIGALNFDIQSEDFDRQLADLTKNGSFALYCRAGRRSTIAAERMVKAGFVNIINLNQGGFAELEAAGAQTV